ncbi:MAG: sigma-70 family RNA polymerase sigma factor [Leptospirales bacterium]|nr:sigma-70 family RNA polymerase sigma factor [Leptospirales bacterium]
MDKPEIRIVRSDRQALPELIDRARHGEETSFAEIVRRFRPSLLRRATAILKDGHLAEDVVQETFLDAHKNLTQLKHNAAFAAWTVRILVKHCDRIRRKKTEISTPPDRMAGIKDNRTDNTQLLEKSAAKSEILRFFAKLANLDQSIAEFYFDKGKSQKEIADTLKIPLHTVKNRIKRVRRNLGKMRDQFETQLRVA